MSRNTILQIIAALITVAALAGIHQGLGWTLDRLSSDFKWGLLVGGIVVGVMVAIALKMDRSSIGRGREQQRSRDIIDL